jgi:hypothetical protein
METEGIGLKILEILSPVLLAALTWAAAKLAQLIRAKVKSEYLRGALVRLDDAVFTAVKDLQQSVVEEIKAASADGKITEDEKKRIKEKALASVKSHLGTKGLSELATVLGLDGGAIEGFLSSKVEAAVHDLRRASAVNGAPAMGGPNLPLAPSPAA